MSVEWFDRPTLDRIIKYNILRTDVILDIGCGIKPQSFFKPIVHICCEPHDEYVQILKKQFSGSSFVILQDTALNVLTRLPDKSIDSIFMLDFIEHVEKEEGLKILSECERIARVQVILFTPLGFLQQDYEEGDTDGWDLHGTEWQVHKSGWTPEDFDKNWNIFGAEIYHTVTGKGVVYDPPHGAFWAIKNLRVHEKIIASNLFQGQPDKDSIVDIQHTLDQLTAQIDHHIIELIKSYEEQTKRHIDQYKLPLNLAEARVNNRETQLNQREAAINQREIEINDFISQHFIIKMLAKLKLIKKEVMRLFGKE